MIVALEDFYLRLNILIALSYLFFRFAGFLFGSRKSEIRQHSVLRGGQFLLLGSLLVPICLEILPKDVLPHLSTEVGLSFLERETVGPLLSTEKRRNLPQISESNKSDLPNRYLTKSLVRAENLRALLLFAAALMLALKLWRLCLQRRNLIQLMTCGTPFREVGKVSVVLSDQIVVPFSALVRNRAWVVLPEKMLGQWTDFKLALCHELQHHRQKDTLWAIVVEFLTLSFALNPFIYYWKRGISELQELSCDEALIGRKVSPYDYGSCLLRVAEAALENHKMLAGTASMASGHENPAYLKSFLRRRIEMLPQLRQRSPFRGVLIGTMGLLMTVAAAFAAKEVTTRGNPDQVTPGIVTTDPEIQKIAESAIESALRQHHASLGFVIVSDPRTGRILAVANKDSTETHPPTNPHWALSLRIGLASLAKPIVAAGAVEKGVTTFSEVHNCENGNYNWGGHLYRDWKPFDRLSTADTIIQSGDICSIKVGQELGAPALANTLKEFGFGAGGAADNFPEARVGEVPEPRSSDDTSYIANISSGMGRLYATPIEVVQAFGAIANGGMLLKPQSTGADATPIVIRRVLSKKTSDEMRDVLAQVMVRGTAAGTGSKLYRLAGKTATGYSQDHALVKGHDLIPNLASFAGFAPTENPRIVIYVGVENPTDKKGAYGAYHAAPVFTEVAEKTLAYLDVPQSK